MKLNCIAFVNAQGTTLLARTSFLPPERIRGEIAALEAVHKEKVYALRSIVNGAGKEVAVEILTPAALECTEGCARVEYWRPAGRRPFLPQFTEGQHIAKSDYYQTGVLITPVKDAVSQAYAYTESPFFRWNPDPLEGKSPASAPGDIFVVTTPDDPSPVAYAVSGIGFTKVDFTG